MRAGFTVSIVGHAAILGFGFLAFSTQPLESEKIDALPVELVSISEETDLLKGDKSAETVPDVPQPLPTVEAETPKPVPAEKPAEKPIEATPPPPPPPPPAPEPEPPPEPEQVASLPEPEAEVAPEPETPAPADAPIPKPRPNPPKPVVQPKPEPEKPRPPVAQPQKPEPEFSTDDIQALLDKQDTAGGTPLPDPAPQTLGTDDGHTGAAMTQSEIAALKARLYRCWNPPVAVREAGSLVVEVRITLLPDGSLSGEPQIIGVTMVTNPLAQVAAEAAVRAVVQCAPFGDILRPENYALWNQIDFVFDPREMLGG